jgi:hypothetical protein
VNARRACHALVLAALAVQSTSACHILGISQIPCDPAVEGQCPDGLVCADAVCVKPEPGGEGEGEGETEVLGPVRDVDENCEDPPSGPPDVELQLRVQAAGAGVGALHDGIAPFGGTSLLRLNADDCSTRASNCALPTTFGASTRAPVGVRAEYAVLDPAPTANDEPATVALPINGQTFAFELIARMPSSAGTVMELRAGEDVALSLSTADTAEGSQVSLSLSRGSALLAFDIAGRWLHVTCVIDPVRARAAAADGVLCSVDGGPPYFGSFGSADRLDAGTLELALPMTGDSAIASLIVWGGVNGIPQDDVVGVDYVIERARTRLLAYNGVVLGTPRALAPAPFGTNKALTLPRDPDLGASVEQESRVLVGGRWPRTARLQGEIDDAALLLEPTRIDLSEAKLRECVSGSDVAFIGIEPAAAVHNACHAVDAEADFETKDPAPLLISAVVQRGRDATTLTVDVSGNGSETCVVSFPFAGPVTDLDCTMTLVVEPDDDPFLERVVLIPTNPPATNAKNTVALRFSDPGAFLDRPAIWGAQVEQGREATSVIDPAHTVGAGRDADQMFLHAANSSLERVQWKIEVETPRIDADFAPLTLTRDLLFLESFFEAGLSFSGGALTSTATVGTFPPTAGAQPATTTTAASSPTFVGARAISAASSEPGDACDGAPDCSSVELAALADGMALSHVVLGGGSSETLRVHAVSALAEGAGAVPLALAARIEPRVNGCPFGASLLTQLELCPEGAVGEQCGDTDNLGSLADASTEPSPIVGRSARVLDRAVTAPLTLDEGSAYLIEARFRVPRDDGPILSVTDDVGNTVLSIQRESGTLGVRADGTGNISAVADEWIQLLCALHQDGGEPWVTCFPNLTAAPAYDTPAPYAAPGGTLTMAAGIAFDRVRVQELTGLAEAGAVLAQLRLPQSFGIHASARRALARWSEARTGLAHVQIDSALYLVGDRWPRMAVATRKPGYLVEPALVDPLADDFSGFAPSGAVSPSSEAGPGSRSQVFAASERTLTAPGAGGPGCASVFVKRLSADARVEIDVGDTPARLDEGTSWRRVSACSRPSVAIDTVRLVVRGEVLLAHPQLDGLSVTAPVVDGVRERSALRISTVDLTLGVFGGDVSIDAGTRGVGVILQMLLPTSTAYSFRTRRAFDADDDEHVVFDMLELEPNALGPTEFFSADVALDPNGALAFGVRETSLWLRSPNGNKVGDVAVLPFLPALEVTVGAGEIGSEDSASIRLHEITVGPILE